jgi:hypothetical protein
MTARFFRAPPELANMSTRHALVPAAGISARSAVMSKTVAGALVVALVLGSAVQAGATPQTDVDADAVGVPSPLNLDSVFSADRIHLSAAQERAIWQAASGLRPQELPPQVVAVPGAALPEATALADIPPGARDEAGGASLDDYRMARVDAGVAIVDPADHTVQAVVTLQEGTGGALAPSGAPVRTLEGATDTPPVNAEIVFNDTPIAEQKPATLGAR